MQTAALSPPHWTRRKAGSVTHARIAWEKALRPAPTAGRGRSSAQNAGLRYEVKALTFLHREFPTFLSHVPLLFTNELGVVQQAVPDGIVFGPDSLTLVEIKRRHTSDGFMQLRYLYYPILQKVFPTAAIQLLEVTSEYDPKVVLPVKREFVDSISKFVLEPKAERFGVFLWTGRFK